jgi:hypothetical protein
MTRCAVWLNSAVLERVAIAEQLFKNLGGTWIAGSTT